MTSGQATANSQPQVYDWSNIATVRRSINRNRSNAGDRYPKYGDPIRYSNILSGQNTAITPSRAGSTEMVGINCHGMLYPHLEERPISHNLRSTKSEYFLAAPRQSHYQRPAYLGVQQRQQLNSNNIDDDTKWITSSSSTASYHSGRSGSSSRGPEEDLEGELDNDRAHLYAEIGKPVSMVSLPPLDRGAPYRRFATSGRVAGGGVCDAGAACCSASPPPSSSSSIYQQTNGVVGDNNAQSTNDLMAVRSAQTPPPPPSTAHMSFSGSQPQQQHHQPRKYFTLNPPRNQSQSQLRVDRLYQKRFNNEDDLRRRSMTPMTTNGGYSCSGDPAVPQQLDALQQQLNRSQSCYGDPLDYKVGCQNTLRSKPLIPWYELAIKNTNRRSCPQFEVDVC